MSVLLSKRNLSKAEFVKSATHICNETVAFCSKLSARYSRIFVPRVTNMAFEVMEFTEKANSMMPDDEQRYQMRRENLLKARASLMSLDHELTIVYGILMQNPSAAFQHNTGEQAKRILGTMAQKLGELIDSENNLIRGVLKSDKERIKRKVQQ